MEGEPALISEGEGCDFWEHPLSRWLADALQAVPEVSFTDRMQF